MSDPFMPIDLRQLSTGSTDRNTQRANNTSENGLSAASAKANENTTQANNAVPQDTVELSSKSQLVSSLISKISSQPEVDQSRVEQLRTSIASGEYTVSADKIASKLLTLDFGHRNHP